MDSVPDYDKFGGQSSEGGPVFSPPFMPRPRGGALRGGQIGNRARAGGPAFGYNNRARPGLSLIDITSKFHTKCLNCESKNTFNLVVID